ncbi:hypothetical protein KFL_003440080 [Klebsormidium nitens]|uniref:Uncharacterized protein n=1 Tax=Klebsormidium nitens TaxID=105231 RepID=A0A1Y1IF27_KLENI|nr:hypothetical protein KFL_003440080 [Klebsormidium nitens]|eukprot:GAQ87307.1 hypothetical protein KFL_003440080 [Klebsormidium nitens]
MPAPPMAILGRCQLSPALAFDQRGQTCVQSSRSCESAPPLALGRGWAATISALAGVPRRIPLLDGILESPGGKGAIPSERPKYGALNLYQHPQGCAFSYGHCLFELLPDVRKRATFTLGDSMSSFDTPATCEHFAHILSGFSSADIRRLVNRKFSDATDEASFLVEAQIHGPIEFWCDMKEIRYSRAEPAETRERLEALAADNAFSVGIF